MTFDPKTKLINLLHKIGTRLIRRIQYYSGASTVGVRVIVLNENNEVLLVKHTYMPGWHFPGGGVKKGETAKAAMLRELREETGVIAEDEPQLLGIFFHVVRGVNDYPVLYLVKKFSMHKSNSPEIAEIAWFHYTHLPEDTTTATRRRLDEYFSGVPPVDLWQVYKGKF